MECCRSWAVRPYDAGSGDGGGAQQLTVRTVFGA